jgi:RNA polymerase-binding transcription factor DksA
LDSKQEDVTVDAKTAMRYRKRLLEELGQRGSLLGKLRNSLVEQGERSQDDGGIFANHMADTATGEADRESDYILVDVSGRTVLEIEEALRRLDEGSFGDCEWCGKAIETKRLEVLPYARFCLKCQEKQEKLRAN